MSKCASNEQTCEVTLNAFDKKVLVPKRVAQLTRKYLNKARGTAMAKLTVMPGKLRTS
jgi:hypothetical protein